MINTLKKGIWKRPWKGISWIKPFSSDNTRRRNPYSIKLFLENKLALKSKEEISSSFSIASILKITRDNLNEIRRIINYLRPKMLDDIGLLATIQWHWQEFQSRLPDIALKMKLAATETDIPIKQKLIIYRIIQEATNNIARHSQPTRIDFELTREKQIG